MVSPSVLEVISICIQLHQHSLVFINLFICGSFTHTAGISDNMKVLHFNRSVRLLGD
jgi:hypothetical protein